MSFNVDREDREKFFNLSQFYAAI